MFTKADSRVFPFRMTGHFHVLCRYVERNAQPSSFVERAEDWALGVTLFFVGFSE